MYFVLWSRAFRDSCALLVSCCMLIAAFLWLRLWIVSQIDFDQAASLFLRVIPEFIEKLLPVPIDVIATIEGRVTFGYEELPVAIVVALWTVTRGSESIAGRQGDGTMELLLSQPIRRLSLLTSHVGVTLLGLALITLAAWLATGLGILTVGFDEPTSAVTYLPAVANLFSMGVCMAGIATLASAVARSRAQAVAFFVTFYVVEITFMIISLMTPNMAWLKNFTFLTAYEPTILTIGLHKQPAEHWAMFWQYNGLLIGLGLLACAVAATIFCHRDVPAPL